MNMIKKFMVPLIMALVYLGLAIWLPATAQRTAVVAVDYIREMALIIPPVFILMGLLQVWIPKEKITALIGKGSGLKGMLISFFMGTIPTGPLYMAFPLAGSLLHKGARTSNIVVFLGSWAAIKVPQLIAETQFLGPSYTALRFILTLMAVIMIGKIMEKIITIEDLPNNKEME